MSKIKVTEKQMKEGFKNIITIGYCEASNLLYFKNPDFYTCGVNGWKSDIYKINYNTIISTGYTPINGKRNYKLVKEYENKASKIAYNYNLSYEQKQKKIDKLIEKFVNEILEKEQKGNKKNEK